MKQKYNGFTLIELMVSVALMLIIIGMTMVIFNSTSTTFTVAEAKVDIMQNARLALDTIAKDIANATDINGSLSINSLTLNIITITNWREASGSLTEKVMVTYKFVNANQFENQQLYYLNREIKRITGQTTNSSGQITAYTTQSITDDNIAEYLVAPDNTKSPFYFEYFTHSGEKSINTTKKNWQQHNGVINFLQELPPLIRITITVTDEHMNACRTLSRMIWIPKGIRRS